jgi:hypothetical protein
MMCRKGWYVKETHGNTFQAGFPDIYCRHPIYMERWLEVKNPLNHSFTPAQIIEFPKLIAAGGKLWITTEATEAEYERIINYKTSNFWVFLARKL